MTWRLVTWTDYVVRSHLVCTELEALLIADMAVRAPGVAVVSVIDKADDGINMPGMIIVTRPNETFVLDGLELEIPCEDVRDILNRLERLPLRHFGEVPYYKLHSFLRCTVLTPAQRDAFMAMLRERVFVAERKSEVFYEGRMLPSEALRVAAAKVTGVAVEDVPDLGGHKVDRFKERGP